MSQPRDRPTATLSASLAGCALAAKRLAERNRSRRNRVRLIGVVSALAVASLLMSAHRFDVNGFVPAVALGALAAGVVLWRWQATITPSLAACPSCGHGWEIKEGRTTPHAEYMPHWDRCPGCGLPMRTELLERRARQGQQTP